ncbi:T-complex protein 1 subunit beta [Coelomomyces lativittatus]|nr:T-complex protein 1 subunit beta [Coelomomyces lativittatus]
MIGEDKLIKFSGVQGDACTIVLRGATHQLLDEAERSIHDALAVLSQTTREPRIVYGGGCSEMCMSVAVDRLANATPGKKALAIAAFAQALRTLPTVLADNAGLDSGELVTRLRAAHSAGDNLMGLDIERADLTSMVTLAHLKLLK